MPLGTEVGLGPGDFELDGDLAPLPKKAVEPAPQFSTISIVAKRLDASRCHLVWRWHYAITRLQTEYLTSIQKHAIHSIYPSTRGMLVSDIAIFVLKRDVKLQLTN